MQYKNFEFFCQKKYSKKTPTPRSEKNNTSANKKYCGAAIVNADNGGGPSSEDEIRRRWIVTTEDKPGRSHNNIILRQDYAFKKRT